MKKITLGFSPCPNDTFIFDALVNHKIDTKGYEFDIHLEDVQTLNEWAIQGKLDITKISYGVWPVIKHNHHLLKSGGALGKGVGPLLIYKGNKPDATTMTVAIPGVNTTAHLLFSVAFPEVKNKKFLVFNQIEDAVLQGQVDAGVIIHENRFTYAQRGLEKWMDLGNYFEQTFNAPIPLGGIVANHRINIEEATQIDALIKESVEYSFKHHYKKLSDFVQCHAQEMSEVVMKQHIDLYVNDFSIEMGDTGKNAIEQLEKVYTQLQQQ
jgi:1,4-dihydroxy-6-naphthoate synthase